MSRSLHVQNFLTYLPLHCAKHLQSVDDRINMLEYEKKNVLLSFILFKTKLRSELHSVKKGI